MEKSIETIWKEGFVSHDALLAPKLNDLYTQKSMSIIDKTVRMFKINLVALPVFGAVMLVISFFQGVPLMGASLFVLLTALVVFGKRELDRLEDIDKGASSYLYLKAFDAWLKQKIALFTKVYRVFYPLFFLSMVAGLWFSEVGESLMETVVAENPGIYLVNGIPVFWLLGVLLIAGLLGVSAGALYRFDVKLVYGRVFEKLDEIIADMEELRS